jgi:serine/threonine-protein kinase
MAMPGSERVSAESDSRTPAPGPVALGWLALVGALSAGWALFQWKQLILARSGKDFFCGIGEFSGGCDVVWDSPLATWVHDFTGLPVAAWGFVWGLVALLLPLWIVVQRRRGRHAEPTWTALLWTGLGGVLGTLVLAGVSLPFGQVCTTCLLTYLLVFVYAASALWASPPLRIEHAVSGALLSGFVVVGVFAFVLVFVGIRGGSLSGDGSSAFSRIESVDSAAVEAALVQYLAELSPQEAQLLSDSLDAYRHSPRLPVWRPRSLQGAAEAPVRITGFSDVLCGHCGHLFDTIELLERLLPPGLFNHEMRFYPLDSACNDSIDFESVAPQRCVGARALICMEDHPRYLEFAAAMFANRRSLTYTERVYEVAEPFISRAELAACLNDPDTQMKLRDDIAWALQHDIQGTPMVLVNGRLGTSFGSFLYAIILAGGRVDHPAFEVLPPPTPSAHHH